MRIVFLAPSAGGGFYCENCVRDAILLRHLGRLGHDAVAVPMYLPAGLEQADIPQSPLFFGGINVYLQQKFPLFAKTPRFLDALLDHPGLLSRAARYAGMTNASQLGQTTLSLLQGSDGHQVKELNRLLAWLSEPENRPDAVVLSNALLLGLAGPIRELLRCAVVCLLQDEDGFIEGLGSPCSEQAWHLMQKAARNVNAFVSVSDYYRMKMAPLLELDGRQIRTIYPGINPADYGTGIPETNAPTIGFLARMSRDNGLDILADAFAGLAGEPSLGSLRLAVCGGSTRADEAYLSHIKGNLARQGLMERVTFVNDFGMENRKRLLQSVSLLCVPFRKPAAFGLCAIEAMACGVGFVEPAEGAFPEYVRLSDAGVLYQPNSVESLSAVLQTIVTQPDRMQMLGRRGISAIQRHWSVEACCRQWIELLEGIVRT